VQNCSRWLKGELKLLQPELIIPVGKLAISQFIELTKLDQIIGREFRVTAHGHEADVIPLPHPSGASTWHRTEPGKTLLVKALALIARHPAWREIVSSKE
jgi:uracil-DNA glycosylase